MLLEDLNPLHFRFTVGDLHFRAKDFEDKLIKFTISDEGGMKIGGFTVTFNDAGEDVDITDDDYPGTLDHLRKGKESDAITRHIKRVVKSTL